MTKVEPRDKGHLEDYPESVPYCEVVSVSVKIKVQEKEIILRPAIPSSGERAEVKRCFVSALLLLNIASLYSPKALPRTSRIS